jgi:polar amino acid transport system substrate-binding protein
MTKLIAAFFNPSLLLAPLFTFLLIYSSSSFAQPTNTSFTLAAPPFTPFTYKESSAQCTGLIDDALKIISARTHIEFNNTRLPYARIVKSMLNNTLDSALIFKNPVLLNSNTKISYFGPLLFSKVILYSRLDKPLNHYKDLYKLRNIAVIRKASFEPRFDQDIKMSKAYVESYTQGLKMMTAKRADAIVGSQVGIEHAMKILDLEIDQFSTFHLNDKEWGLHYQSTLFNAEQKKQLQLLTEKRLDPYLLYMLYLKNQQMHTQCSKSQ